MKKILGVLTLGLFAMAAFSMRALADDEACCQGMKMGMHGEMMKGMHEGMEQKMDLDEMFTRKAHLITENATELGLSDEQLQKVKALKMSVRKSAIKSDADVELLVLDIEDALMKDEVDVNGVNALIDKKYGIKAQETKTLVSAYADLKRVLTKDQMKKLHDIWNKEKMGEGKCTMMQGKSKMMEGKEGREHKAGMGMH